MASRKAATNKQDFSDTKIYKLVKSEYDKIIHENLEIYQNNLGKLEVENERLRKMLEDLQEKHNKEVELSKRVSDVKKSRKEILLERIAKEEELETLTVNHDRTIKTMRASHEQEVEELKRKHQNAVQKLKTRLQNEKDEAVKNTAAEYGGKLSRLEEESSKEIKQLKRQTEVLGNKVAMLTTACEEKDSKIDDLMTTFSDESEKFQMALRQEKYKAAVEARYHELDKEDLRDVIRKHKSELYFGLIESFKDEVSELKRCMQQKDTTIDALRSCKFDSDCRINALDGRNLYLQSKVSELEKNLLEMKNKLKEVGSEETQAKLEEMENQIKKLTDEKATLQESLKGSKSAREKSLANYQNLKKDFQCCMHDLKKCSELPFESKQFKLKFKALVEKYAFSKDYKGEELEARFQEEINAMKEKHKNICSAHEHEIKSLKAQLAEAKDKYLELRRTSLYAENEKRQKMAEWKSKYETAKGEALWTNLRSNIKKNSIEPKIDCWRENEGKTQADSSKAAPSSAAPSSAGPSSAGPSKAGPVKVPVLKCAYQFAKPPQRVLFKK